MKIHRLTVQEALAGLQSGPSGLSDDEARRRLQEFGPNRVERIRAEPLLLRFLKSFSHFFALILWLAAGLAFFAEWNDPGTGMAPLGIAILGVILINGLFSFWQEYRAEQAVAALRKLLPPQVHARRDGKLVQLSVEALVPGDLIALEGGDHIPADCRLIRAFGVRVDTATITGESLPKAREAQASDREELIQSKNILLAGTAMVSGEATTACLSAIIVMQVVNLFLCRSERDSAAAFGLFSNRLLIWGIITELALILWIDYSGWGRRLFNTAPIGLEVWLFVLPFAAGMLVLEETRKWWLRANR